MSLRKRSLAEIAKSCQKSNVFRNILPYHFSFRILCSLCSYNEHCFSPCRHWAFSRLFIFGVIVSPEKRKRSLHCYIWNCFALGFAHAMQSQTAQYYFLFAYFLNKTFNSSLLDIRGITRGLKGCPSIRIKP